MAQQANSRLTWDYTEDRHDYGSHRIGDVYAAGNARIFLGNADRVNLGSDEDDHVQPINDQKLLLKALYYEVMNHRRNQILSATKETCEWIWQSDFRNFLVNPKTKVFWITGKPGSGKSTLMKYLAKSLQELKQILPGTWKYPEGTTDISWTTVNFFFDFRLATKLGNSLEGLLRTLLYQFAKALPHLIRKFAPDSTQYKDFSLGQLKAALDRALISTNAKDSRMHVLILVDGLDEFEGKIRGILDFLLLLSEHENAKLCLASRPESMIREKLAKMHSLSVSNHNDPGIRHFIRDATAEFQPRLDTLRLNSIQSLILTRALGVFLWVYYAVEETLQAYVEGATIDEIRTVIMDLPEELESIYERIVLRIPCHRKTEAAILYLLISEADFNVSLELLQSTLYLLIHYYNVELVDIEDLDHFSRRLHATMGGLIDVVASTDASLPHRTTHVRLMHETVKSFTVKSCWTKAYLPAILLTHATADVWFDLGRKALFSVKENESMRVAEMLMEIYQRDMVRHMSDEPIYRSTGRTIKPQTSRDTIVLGEVSTQHGSIADSPGYQQHERLVHLLYHSIIFIPPVIAKMLNSSNPSTQVRRSCKRILTARLMAWHFVFAKCLEVLSDVSAQLYDIAGFATLPMDHKIQDLLLASAYRIYGYLEENMRRISSSLDGRQRDELVGTILASSFRWPQRGRREWINSQSHAATITPKFIGDMLAATYRKLLHADNLSSFHLAVCLAVGHYSIPLHIQGLQRKIDGYSMRHWPNADLPMWAATFDAIESGRLETWFPIAPLLDVWKSEYRVGGQVQLAKRQLILLKTLGVDMNDSFVEASLSVPRSALETLLDPEFVQSHAHIHSSSSELAHAIGKRLHRLEGRGAPFPASPASLIDLDEAARHGRLVLGALMMLHGLLVHRAQEGHLPQPLPARDATHSQHFCDVCVRPYTISNNPGTLLDTIMAQDLCCMGVQYGYGVERDVSWTSQLYGELDLSNIGTEDQSSLVRVALDILQQNAAFPQHSIKVPFERVCVSNHEAVAQGLDPVERYLHLPPEAESWNICTAIYADSRAWSPHHVWLAGSSCDLISTTSSLFGDSHIPDPNTVLPGSR